MDDHQSREEENGSVGDLSTVCSQVVLNRLYVARFDRPHILFSFRSCDHCLTVFVMSLNFLVTIRMGRLVLIKKIMCVDFVAYFDGL